jgi:DNA-binding MarR family transcriptional regulator
MSRKSKDSPGTAARQALIAGIGIATQAFQRSTDAFDDLVAQRLGLNRTDLRCLDWLFEGAKTAGQLAAATGLSSAATTTLIDRLERRGLVQRVRDPADRRKVLVELTETGRRETGQFYSPLAQQGARMLERYTDAQLTAMRDHLLSATALIDRHRERLQSDRTPRPDET